MNSIINKTRQMKKFKKSGDKLKEQNQQEIKTGYTNMKFVRLATNATSDKRKEVADKISKGQLKLSHFAVDGELSYHYYQILNVRTPRTKK